MNQAPNQNKVVFVSYSHRDKDRLKRLQQALKPIVRKENFELWDDTKISAGDKWREQIQAAIQRAHVAVLLVSIDFLASDFINENELPPLLDKAQKKDLRIVWIPIGDCMYEETEIADYQSAWSPEKPLSSLNESEQDNAWKQIGGEIKKILFPPKQAPKPSPADQTKTAKPKRPRQPPSIRGKVIQEVAKILSSPGWQSICEDLAERLRGRKPDFRGDKPAALAAALADRDRLNQMMACFALAMRQIAMRSGEEAGYRTIERFWRQGAEALGWLVLLNVDEAWVQKNKASLAASPDFRFVVPVKTRMGGGVSLSRIHGEKADLDRDETQEIKGLYEMDFEAPLETGWHVDDHVAHIKQSLFTLLKPGAKPPAEFTPDQNDALDEILAFRAEEGKRPYLSVLLSEERHPLNHDEAIYAQLKRDLPNLSVLFLQTEGHESVVFLEGRLKGVVDEFFRLRDEALQAVS